MDMFLTTVVFHRFFFNGEPVAQGRERLKRYCDWLSGHYTPLSLGAATAGVQSRSLPMRPLLITIDDALIDILDVKSVFDEFQIPIAIFACVGWCECAGPEHLGEDSQLASIVTMIEWYFGPDRELGLGGSHEPLKLGRTYRRDTIDGLLASQAELRPLYPELLARLKDVTDMHKPRNVCTWGELADLKAAGAAVGSHSVSHVNLGAATPARMTFEIMTAQRVLRDKFGKGGVFAYPYGIPGSFNSATKATLKSADVHFAFSARYDFAGRNTDPYEIPRIALPERPMGSFEFHARLTRAGAAIWRAKDLVRGYARAFAS